MNFSVSIMPITDNPPRCRLAPFHLVEKSHNADMGPTNVALVKLFRADQAMRTAMAHLDSASSGVRALERRMAEQTEAHTLAQAQLREHQSKTGQLELDIKSHDARLERLRTQQQSAKTNKEYQVFLTEISTIKVDKAKVEEDALVAMDLVEKAQAEVKAIDAQLQETRQKHETMRAKVGSQLDSLQSEIRRLAKIRDEATVDVPAPAREAFERLVAGGEEEAMSPLAKPDRRHEEYICGACNMTLVADLYNRLHSRDDLVFCPNCHRLLYIPDDLPPETAIHGTKGARKSPVASN